MRKFIRLFSIIALVFISACGVPEEKGLIKPQESCIRTNLSGRCEGDFEKVVGDNIKTYDNIFFENEEAVYLDITVSCSEKPMSFAVHQFGIADEWTVVTVDPLKPGAFKGWVIPDENGKLAIKFTQDGKNSTGKVHFKFDVSR